MTQEHKDKLQESKKTEAYNKRKERITKVKDILKAVAFMRIRVEKTVDRNKEVLDSNERFRFSQILSVMGKLAEELEEKVMTISSKH